MSLARQIRRYARELAAVIGVIAVGLVVGAYVLAHQRLHFPWQPRYTLAADFSTAQAVTPGQGQSVDVAGVKVGEVASVALHDGRARVTMSIDPGKLPRVYADARALLRPKTALQDMSIALDPGRPPAPRLRSGAVLPVEKTLPNVNLDEILAELDADTRDYLRMLVAAGAQGLKERGGDLRRLFKAAGPTLEQTRRVSAAFADRRAKVARLVRNLRVLSEAAAGKDRELGQLVAAGSVTLDAIASRERDLRDALKRLPGTVAAARDALASARPFAERLAPTLDALLPAARRLEPAVTSVRPALREGTPDLSDVNALVAAGRPALGDLRPATRDLLAVTPSLTSAFHVLEYVVNELAYRPPDGHGYLFWLAWFAHNGNSVFSVEDAHGAVWRGQVLVSCSTIDMLARSAPLSELVRALPTCPAKPVPPAGGLGGGL
jgi:phospholipid/cholesterol/gamma-HCH transport system substrate-binding protein